MTFLSPVTLWHDTSATPPESEQTSEVSPEIPAESQLVKSEAEVSHQNPFHKLPPGFLASILSYLNEGSLASTNCVNKLWYGASIAGAKSVRYAQTKAFVEFINSSRVIQNLENRNAKKILESKNLAQIRASSIECKEPILTQLVLGPPAQLATLIETLKTSSHEGMFCERLLEKTRVTSVALLSVADTRDIANDLEKDGYVRMATGVKKLKRCRQISQQIRDERRERLNAIQQMNAGRLLLVIAQSIAQLLIRKLFCRRTALEEFDQVVDEMANL